MSVITEKQALEALERGEQLTNRSLALLRDRGLIEVADVTDHDTPLDEREFLFTFFTERGKKLLES